MRITDVTMRMPDTIMRITVVVLVLSCYGIVAYAQAPVDSRTPLQSRGVQSISTSSSNDLSAALKDPKLVLKLDLSGQNLTTLTDSIGLFGNLEELNLGRNKLKSLPISVGELRKLRVLRLAYNNFTEVPLAIRDLAHLEVLNISNNPITTLDERAFTGLANLKELRMDFLKVSVLPTSIGSCLNLNVLSAEGNALKALPAFIGNLKQLTSVNVSSNDISVIADTIFTLPSLETLTINANKLKGLPDALGASRLRTFEADSNAIDSVPASIGGCKNLERLSLAYNKLTTVPKEIGKCQNLGYLDISGNALVALPVKELASLSALSVLRIANKPGMQKE